VIKTKQKKEQKINKNKKTKKEGPAKLQFNKSWFYRGS